MADYLENKNQDDTYKLHQRIARVKISPRTVPRQVVPLWKAAENAKYFERKNMFKSEI